MAEADELKNRIKKLEAENSFLKTLLEQAGIEVEPFEAGSQPKNTSFIPDQRNRILTQPITSNHARRFYSYFWGRTDVYNKRSKNKTQERRHTTRNAIISGDAGSVRRHQAQRSNARIAKIGAGQGWKALKSKATCADSKRMPRM